MQKYKMWINGKWVNAVSSKTYKAINPATEEDIAEVPLGGKADVDKAVEAARQAFPIWSKKTQAERSKIVSQIGAAIVARAKEFVELNVLDHGTPVRTAWLQTLGYGQHMEYAAQASRALMADNIPLRPGALTFLRREPRGVCALIIPWNVALMMIVAKLGAALAVGNTCVIKPPSIDSLEALKLGEILEGVDLPPGTVNIITGPGGTMGEALASHPGIDYISFTGSCETGKRIMEIASRAVKPVHLELGGKNPFIVLEDANLDAAAAKAVMAQFANTGMICASPGRYYIHKKLHDEFVSKFVELTKKNVITGDPSDEKTTMGPVVSAEHRDRVEGYIKKGISEGARLVLGGKRPAEPPLNRGYFVVPTVFTGVKQDMTIAREEIFGPVACIMEPFTDEDKVIELANDNTFGLSASVWTESTARWTRFTSELCAGTCWVNDHLSISPELPWGGFKESGFGKESSFEGLKEYTRLKLINVNVVPVQMPPAGSGRMSIL
jgi:acyl-CoA reductase-like NAD-dependent aldehyde dehydrogenase